MNGDVELRRITANDFQLWKKMRNALYNGMEEAFDDHEMKTIIDDPQWHCMFVTLSKDVIGFVELSLRNIVDGCLHSPVPYIEGIYLQPQYQTKGYGKDVMKLIKKWSKNLGFSELAADTELHNHRAQKFFSAMGFQETYRTVGFKIDLSE